jgi:predicted nucleotidyltransferase
MLIDITSIIIIFSSDYLDNNKDENKLHTYTLKVSNKKKNSKKKLKKNHKNNKKNICDENKSNLSKNNIDKLEDKEKNSNKNNNQYAEIISLYDNNCNSSIKTYHLM